MTDTSLRLLHNKIKEVVSIIKSQDTVRFSILRKIIGIILDSGDENLIDILETFLAKSPIPDYFFILLEEKVKRELKTDKSEKLFISLMAINTYDLSLINKYLTILKKDAGYLVLRLLDKNIYHITRHALARYVWHLGQKDIITLRKHVVPSVLKYYRGSLDQYLGLVREIVACTTDFTRELLYDGKYKCETDFRDFVIQSYNGNINLITNFCRYLQIFNPYQLSSFEDNFLATASGGDLFKYAIRSATSDKRKILRRLVSLKDERLLVQYIKAFPQFESLLPML